MEPCDLSSAKTRMRREMAMSNLPMDSTVFSGWRSDAGDLDIPELITVYGNLGGTAFGFSGSISAEGFEFGNIGVGAVDLFGYDPVVSDPDGDLDGDGVKNSQDGNPFFSSDDTIVVTAGYTHQQIQVANLEASFDTSLLMVGVQALAGFIARGPASGAIGAGSAGVVGEFRQQIEEDYFWFHLHSHDDGRGGGGVNPQMPLIAA